MKERGEAAIIAIIAVAALLIGVLVLAQEEVDRWVRAKCKTVGDLVPVRERGSSVIVGGGKYGGGVAIPIEGDLVSVQRYDCPDGSAHRLEVK